MVDGNYFDDDLIGVGINEKKKEKENLNEDKGDVNFLD